MQVPLEVRGINSLGLETQTDVCLSIQVLGVDSGSLGKQQVLLTAEPSFLPPAFNTNNKASKRSTPGQPLP